MARTDGGPGWQRRWLSITCAVLAAIVLPVAVLTVWARSTLLDTSEYVATVAPLAADEDIQEAISFQVTETVAEAADYRAIAEDALPEDAQAWPDRSRRGPSVSSPRCSAASWPPMSDPGPIPRRAARPTVNEASLPHSRRRSERRRPAGVHASSRQTNLFEDTL